MHLAGIDVSLNHTAICIDGVCSEIIVTAIKGVYRLEYVFETIKKYLADVRFLALEDYSYGSRGNATLRLAELGGCLRLWLYRQKVSTMIVPPTVLKKFVGCKGNAKKVDVVNMYNSTHHTSYTVLQNDVVDSRILYEICVACLSSGVRRFPKCSWLVEDYEGLFNIAKGS